MEPEILDLVRRWLRKFGVLGTIASAAFGIYVELPVAERAVALNVQTMLERVEKQRQRAVRRSAVPQRRHKRAMGGRSGRLVSYGDGRHSRRSFNF